MALQAAFMVQRVQVELVDDVDGKTASETVTFGLDGVSYEIDLSDKNAKALRKSYETWIAAARRVGGRRSGATTRVATDVDSAAVRAWAASNGHDIPARGRISREIIEKYRAAGN
jgi:Lsr2